MNELSEEDVQSLYTWIDEIPLSRPKKNISRDFSDGVACAEVICHFAPKLVDLHNYSPANSVSQKIYNWTTLNHRVFRRLGYSTNEEIIHCIVNSKPGYIEYLLYELRQKIDQYLERKARQGQDHHDSNSSRGHDRLHPDGKKDSMSRVITSRTSMTDLRAHPPPLPSTTTSMHLQAQQSSTSLNGFHGPTQTEASQLPGGMSGSRPIHINMEADHASATMHKGSQSNIRHATGWTSPPHQSQIYNQSMNNPTLSLSPRGSITNINAATTTTTQHHPTSTLQQLHRVSGSSLSSQQHVHSSHSQQVESFTMPNPASSTASTHPYAQGHAQQHTSHQRYMFSPTQHHQHQQMKPNYDGDLVYELQDTINILQLKVSKLEQLLMLKDQRIQELMTRVTPHGV